MMQKLVFIKETEVPATPAALWAFHEQPDSFTRFLPPFERTSVLQAPDGIRVGSQVRTRTWIGPVPTLIEATIMAVEPGRFFEDEMQKGPFTFWQHRHEFIPSTHGQTTIYRDTITYLPPLGFLGRWVDPILIRPRLKRVFDYRHEVVLREFGTLDGTRNS